MNNLVLEDAQPIIEDSTMSHMSDCAHAEERRHHQDDSRARRAASQSGFEELRPVDYGGDL